MAAKKKATTAAKPADVTKGPRLPVGDIPEVQEVVDLKQEIDALKANNPDVFMQYTDLVDRYNAALEVADKKVREQGVSCGPFDNFSMSVTYDAERMYDELGEDLFLKCGGKKAQVTTYTVDTAVVEAAIASGKVPAPCVPEFRTVGRKYHTPKKLSV